MLILPAALAFTAAIRVLVVPVGGDAAAAGSLERAIETRLRGVPGVTVVEAAETMAAVGPVAPPKPDAAIVAEDDRLLAEATSAYFDGRAAYALERLAGLQGSVEKRTDIPPAFRIRLRLWRATTYLTLNDTEHAEAECADALALDPDLKLDLAEFRPTLADVLARVRERKITWVSLTVTGLPAGARLTVDGRPALADGFRLPKGTHIVAASAPGYRESARIVEATSSWTLALPLAVAIPSDLDATLSRLVWQGPAAADPAVLTPLLMKVRADYVVVAAVRGMPADGSRALVISADTTRRRASPIDGGAGEGIAATASWVETALREEQAPRRTNVGPGTSPSTGGGTPGKPLSFDLSAHGGVAISERARSIAGHSMPVSGAGVRVAADVATSGFDAELAVHFLQYSLSKIVVTLPDHSQHTVNGGSGLGADLDVGRAFPVSSFAIRPSIALHFDQHSAVDVSDATGARAKLLPSTSEIAPEVRGTALVPFGGGSGFAGLGVSPLATVSESPSGSSGTSPSAGLGLSWRLGGTYLVQDRWSIRAGYDGRTRSTKYSGTAAAPFTPAATNATVTETEHTFAVEASTRF